ncbi:MAG: hypothetical protein J07HQX50_02079, partial [Haloquadratum sp. J07HQX50]
MSFEAGIPVNATTYRAMSTVNPKSATSGSAEVVRESAIFVITAQI